MFKSYQLILLILTGFVLFSCKKEMDTFTPDPITGSLDIGQLVEARISGTVYNDQAQPIVGATVTLGQDQVLTDENGVFLFDQASVHNRLGHLTIEKQGYFKVPKSFTLGENLDIQIHTVLLSRNQSGSFSAISGGQVTQGGLSLEFPSGAIVSSNGQPFLGNVRVYAAVIDPDHEYFSMIMPGMLFGERLDGSGVSLATFGMIAVELETSSGQPLQVAEGNTVKTTMPIPASQLSHAPSEIPMWSMDKNAPYWKEETIARKEGSFYVADLPHFSFWNCDAPFPTTKLKFKVVDEAGQGLPNQHLQIVATGIGISGFGQGDILGNVNAIVPANENLEIYILNSCNELTKIADVGPFTPDSENDIGQIEFEDPDAPIMIVRGSILGCDGAVAPSTYALIKHASGVSAWNIPYEIAFANESGQFESALSLCGETGTIEVTGFDPINVLNSASNIQPFDINESADINVGTLTLCEEPDQFIDLTVDDHRVVFLDSIVSNIQAFNNIWFVLAQQSSEFLASHNLYLGFQLLSGIPIQEWLVNEPYEGALLNAATIILGESEILQTQDSFGELTFTMIDLDNKILRGTFSGITYGTNAQVSVEMDFKLKIPD